METSFGAAAVKLVLFHATIAAIFGAVAWWLFRRRGALQLLPLWAGTVIVCGAYGALRAYLVLPTARRPLAIAVGGLLAAFLAIVLVPPAFALRRRTSHSPTAGIGAVAASSAAWSLVGIVLATTVALTLDLFGVPFLPGRH